MSLNLRSIRFPTLAVAGCLALTAIAGAGSASAASCNPPKEYPGSGYFLGKITTTNISCSYAKKFVVSYYRCRIRAGGVDGRCARINSFRCTERRETIPTEIDARVTCRRGTQKIIHTYQQFIE